MSTFEWIVLGGLFLLIFAVLILVYRKRNLLFFNAHFTAETTMMNYQTDAKRSAMEQVAYMKEEKEEDDEGEKKG